jgi:ankyrin repeat protein/S1-C subfamily serine protease
MRCLPWTASLLVVASLVLHSVPTHTQGGAQANVGRVLQDGLAALKENRPDDAITAFRTGLELNARDETAAFNLARAYSMKKDAAALEWLSRAADWGFENVDQIFENPDLTFVRSQPGFPSLIEEIQKRFPESKPRRSFSKNETDRGLELVAMVRSEVGSGAAMIIGRDANRLLLATANHVVRKSGTEAHTLEVQLKSLAPRWEKAAVLPAIEDPELDLAFISVENIIGRDLNVCDLPLHLAGDASRLKRGDAVFPVGYPNGILWAMPLTADRASQVFPTQISFESQFIRVGFSGGALLNQAGEVVGMITADEPPLGRAIPLASILKAARTRQYSALLADTEERVTRPLHAAAREGNVSALRRLLENCVDPNGADDKARTALHEAAVHGSADAIQLLLRAGARLHAWTMIREEKTEREWGTALHLAAQSGQLAAVKALLDAGEDVDLRTLRRVGDKVLERRDTPLQVAARHDRAEVAEALLAAGAAHEPPGRYMMTPLEIAAASGSVGVARVLIQHGALQAVPNRNGVTSPLHYAAEAGSAEMLRLLADSGLYVNLRDDDSDTPLHKAAERGQVSAVEALLSLKADLNAEGDDFKTPLYVAAEQGKSDVVKLLLANGADPNKFVKGRVNALAVAAERIDVESVKALVAAHADIGESLNRLLDSSVCRRRDRPNDCLERSELGARILIDGGADLRVKIRDGRQPLHFAAANGLANTVTLLVERGAPLTTGTEGENVPPLQLAAEEGHVEVVRRLITAKAPLNQQDAGGRTALYRAVDKKLVNVVNVLLQAGADPNIGNKVYHDTPVLEAASSSEDILALLLKAGGNPNSGFAETRVTALHRAARERNAEAVRLLLQAGATASADNDGSWPLHAAIQSSGSDEGDKRQLAIIELLVKSGSPVDAADDERATPLHKAADRGNAAAVKTLLSANARVNAVDKCGLTPLGHVLNQPEELALAVAELLLNAGADINVRNKCRRQTLLQMVEDRGYVTLRQLLVARGAR